MRGLVETKMHRKLKACVEAQEKSVDSTRTPILPVFGSWLKRLRATQCSCQAPLRALWEEHSKNVPKAFHAGFLAD